ncbi:type II secretion system F family protein [Evansella sp. AB-P1]|uniref:type II secretion system F family protein n=1 Tax=Evansella sp. AB-P1 TaxID=3037653 RepID=UPI00241CBE3E|nr:type II secretion system F family protein [Evansella sp. AB-P1]MDG5790063.1 type II secretion system F family protein [Evansella sp. AB-P1]
MKEVLIVTFFLSTILFFSFIFQRLLLRKDKQMEKRVNQYLLQNDKEILEPKKLKKTIDFRLTKEKIRKQLVKKDKNTKIETMLTQAGVPLKPEEYVLFKWISIGLGAGIFYLISQSIFIVPFGVLVGMMLPKIILQKKKKDRLKRFNEGLPEMISTIIGALRAGFSFPQAMQSVMEESSSPIKEEIATVLKEMQYGTTVEEALIHLKERMPSEDLDIMIQAIVIQRQVGGNLATVLETIVQTIRDRIKIQGQISTLTAQGRMSGMVVGLLPVILGALLFIIEPDYMGVLISHPVGLALIGIAVVSCILGFIFIRKITAIEV